MAVPFCERANDPEARPCQWPNCDCRLRREQRAKPAENPAPSPIAVATQQILSATHALDTDHLMGMCAVILTARISRECSHAAGLETLARFNHLLNRTFAVWEEVRQHERNG